MYPRLPSGAFSKSRLPQQAQDRLRLLVGLRQHGLRRLPDDVALGKFGRGLRVIGVLDPAAAFLRLGGDVGEVVAGELQAADHGAHVGPLKSDRIQRSDNRAQRRTGGGCRRDLIAGDRRKFARSGRGRHIGKGEGDGLATVGTNLEGENARTRTTARAVKHIRAVPLGLGGDDADLRRKGLKFEIKVRAIIGVIGVIGGLNREFTHAQQHVRDLLGGPLSGLDQRNAVVCIANSLVQTADLRGEPGADSHTRHVVNGIVDTLAG